MDISRKCNTRAILEKKKINSPDHGTPRALGPCHVRFDHGAGRERAVAPFPKVLLEGDAIVVYAQLAEYGVHHLEYKEIFRRQERRCEERDSKKNK